MIEDFTFNESPIEAITELVEITLQVLVTHTMIGAPEKGFCVPDKDIDGPEPLSQRNTSPMKQGLCGHRGLMAAVPALKQIPFLGEIRFMMPSFRTDEPVRPAKILKILETLFFRLKPLLKLEEIDLSIRTHVYPILSVMPYMGVNIYILIPFVKQYELTQ